MREGAFGAFRTLALVLLTGLLPVLSACSHTPPYQGMTATQVFEMGMQAFEEEDWDEASQAFEQFLFSFPTHENAPEARYHLARTHFEKEEYITAVSDFSRMVARYPTHRLAPLAALGTCQAYGELSPIPQRDQTYTHQAIRACNATIDDWPGTNVAEEAREIRQRMRNRVAESVYVAGEFYHRRNLHDSALIYFEDLLERFPETPAAPKALKRMVETYGVIGYDDEEAEARERLLNEYPDSPQARELREARGNGA